MKMAELERYSLLLAVLVVMLTWLLAILELLFPSRYSMAVLPVLYVTLVFWICVALMTDL